jgi:L-seryl-tRNA(Ser) seleniumtransferase
MNDLRRIPSVDSLLEPPFARDLAKRYGRSQLLFAIRKVLDDLRNSPDLPLALLSPEGILKSAEKQLAALFESTIRPVINATGVVLHTNLGRAPLSQETLTAMQGIGTSYSTLEYDLAKGKRGARSVHAEKILMQLTGAEAAAIVNNNASAVLIALSAFANRKRVVISRTQLIEIGGGFRIPDVMKLSGAKLIEIGATNQVHLNDYEEALQHSAALVMRAHHSNFRIVGFTGEPEISEICELSHHFGVPVLDDLGSGTFLDTAKYGLSHEPTIAESLKAGADLITFSGDKLLGGPQAGIILGKKVMIDKIKKHPLARAVRPDKTCLAGINATLTHYLRDEAELKIPIWQMISKPLSAIEAAAKRWQEQIGQGEIKAGLSTIGGGSLPDETLPTALLALQVQNPTHFLKLLRELDFPIIARIEDNCVLFDPRTVFASQEEPLLRGIKAALP